ncbi:MAG: hypothetical protein ACRDJG_07990 [Actinomycetota bacterium]
MLGKATRGGALNRAELFSTLVAARPQPGDVVYIERRADAYAWRLTRPGESPSTDALAGDASPEAWIYFSGVWPLDDRERLGAFFDDLLAELESMCGGPVDRCRWSLDQPYPLMYGH